MHVRRGVIWNAVPVEEIQEHAAAVDTEALRTALRVPAGAPVIGIVGRLAEEKGHVSFLDIAGPDRRGAAVRKLRHRGRGTEAGGDRSARRAPGIDRADLDVFRDVYTHERDVIKIPLGDPDTAARAVVALLEDADLAERLRKNADELLESCSMGAILPRHSRIYERLLRRPGDVQ